MALSKERKTEIISQYEAWLNRSRAVILVEYTGLSMNELEELRHKTREVGGEFHVVKNTLGKLAVESSQLQLVDTFFRGSTAIGFAFEDPPAMAKVLSDYAKSSDHLVIKGGYLEREAISAEGVSALGDLPPLPVMRATLLATLLAPAGKLVRTIAEPVRQIAQVVKVHADQLPNAA